jgi:hypothetical protein
MRSQAPIHRIHIRSRRYWTPWVKLASRQPRSFAPFAGSGKPQRPGTGLPRRERNTNVKLVEPPSCNSASTITFIGRNCRGNWVAQEQHGLYGGLFINRDQAFKYALFENGHRPETIVELAREIELDISGKAVA